MTQENEKSQFLQMFEKLSPEEQDKVTQIAMQMGELIAKKGVKKL
jgi:hypothetical protein